MANALPTYTTVNTFGASATKVTPDTTTYANGYLPGAVFPAQHENYFLNGMTSNDNQFISQVNMLQSELLSLLTQYSISPNGTTIQLRDLIVAQLALKANINSQAFTGTPSLPTGTTATTQSANDNSTKLATTAYTDTGLALKSNLASPTFTGTPSLPTGTTATTQSANDNSTKLATTAYTDTGLALKSNLASPAFTGTPSLPTGTTAITQSRADNSTKLATTAYADNSNLPIGSLIMFSAIVAPNSSWMICDGSPISRTTYSSLYGLILTTYGSGDGSTTFNLPDMREAVPVMLGTYSPQTGYNTTTHPAITAHDAFSIGQFKDDQFQGHGHPTNRAYGGGTGQDYQVSQNGSGTIISANYGAGNPVIISNGGPRVGDLTRGKRIGMNFIIKVLAG